MKVKMFLMYFLVAVVNSYGQNSDEYNRIARISDPDGYTNVRDEPNRNARIIGKVYDNESFRVETSANDWWKVLTQSGVRGYMHKSRIQLFANDNGVTENSSKTTNVALNMEYYYSNVIGIWANTTNKQQWSFYSELGKGSGLLKITYDDWENYGVTNYRLGWSKSNTKQVLMQLQNTAEEFVLISLTSTKMKIGKVGTNTILEFNKVSNFAFIGN